MAERIRIASRHEISPGTGKVVVAGARVLALFNVEGGFHATDNSCPHRGGPLGEGTLDGAVVTCPWHGWQFDVRSGESPLKPNLRVRCVRVESDGDALYACLE